ncbi:hypothetical protein FRC11_009353 [Ceratobasidium sp. 423]|nr:hypothetical protein FRC11_009353 [Ceratobasidium sp. 423]
MVPNPFPMHEPDMAIEQPEDTVEVLWLPVTILRLRDFYPKWTSKLYHGLTELRLTGQNGSIPGSTLATILGSSPKLRVLQISIKITHTTPSDFPIIPVNLVDLEIFVPYAATEPEYAILLRLVQPGPKPLSLSIVTPWSYQGNPILPWREEAKNFFARSNVTRLVAKGFRKYAQIADLLTIAPTVRVLALEEIRCTKLEDERVLPPPTPLDALYVTRSTRYGQFAWPCVERVVQRHRVRKLTLWWYEFCCSTLQTVPENLYSVCSSVTLLSDNDPDPVQEWK